MDEEEILLRPEGLVDEPATVPGGIEPRDHVGSLGDPTERPSGDASRGLEGDLLEESPRLISDVDEVLAVAREAEQHARRARGGDRRGFSQHAPGALVDRYAPEVGDAAPVAREVEIAPVGGPDRIPVDVLAPGDRDRLATVGRNRPDHPLAGVRNPPVGDPETVRRPTRLHGIALVDPP